MRYLVVDQGNSRLKIAIFEGEELLVEKVYTDLERAELESFLREWGVIDGAIVCKTAECKFDIVRMLEEWGIGMVVDFSHTTPLEIKNSYAKPSALGLDRLASAVAAHREFPQSDLLVIDLGTAITVDHVTKDGEFCGGSITSGMRMRFDALNHFTERLPRLSSSEIEKLSESYERGKVAKSTDEAIFYGVIDGICREIEGVIAENSEKIVYFTGGDALFFDKKIKIPIFVDCRATLKGLRAVIERLC